MNRILIENADVIVTMNDDGDEISNGHVLIEDGQIVRIGTDRGDHLPEDIDERIDATGCIVTPGLINTHHHLYQTLTRAVPAAQDAPLFGWLKTLYPIWARMRPEDVRLAAEIGLSSLALSGCTLTSDHHYLYPDGVRLEDTIEAAHTVGVRLLATRGSMSIGQSKGGLPPDSLVEREDDILKDTDRLITAFHDPSPGAMIQIAVAPCSPFSVSRELMRDSAILARERGVRLHTHLAENDEDVAYSLEKFGCRPGDYAEALGWTGSDVWHAHCVKLDDHEIDLFGKSGTGVAHCPCSNCRLGSGIAPVNQMRAANVPVGLGVDGSASNDAAHLLSEARQALLMQRVANGASAMSARDALRLATRGGARVLGRTDLGMLSPGYRADIAIWPTATVESTGAWDPVAALVLSGPHTVRDLLVDGRRIVSDGRMVRVNPTELARHARNSIRRLANGE